MSHNARPTNTGKSRQERRLASSRTRRRQPLFFAAQASKLSLSGSLGRAEGTLKCHARNGDGGTAIVVLRVSSVFGVYIWVFVLFERSSYLVFRAF